MKTTARALSGGIEPNTRVFLEALNASSGPAIHELSVQEARAVLEGAQKVETPVMPAEIEDTTFPCGPGGKVSVRLVRPKGSGGSNGSNGAKAALPAIVYCHGGGWVLGSKDTHDRLIRKIANGANACVVFVNFTPAPEARYPVAIEEAYAVTEYVAENSKALNIDPSRLVVAGDSVGGNMAAAVTLMAGERGGPRIDYQVLFYPVTSADFDTPSYKEFATDHFLTREAMKWFWNHYCPDEARRKEPTASPLLAPIERLRGLPPALVINGEFDVLRDEGEAYAHRLTEAGVHVTAVRFLGTIHDFVLLNAITNTPAPRGALALATMKLRELFER